MSSRTTHGSHLADDLQARLSRLERHNRRLTASIAAVGALAGLILLGSAGIHGMAEAKPDASDTGVVRAHELVIVDDKGIVRARVGANLPDAIIGGKRMSRDGEKVSGIMLYDSTGQERGGYLTFEPSGIVGLTLDSRKAQNAMFVADADGGSALQLWTREGSVELRSDPDGSRLTSTSAGKVLEQLPAIPQMTDRTCLAYKEALTRVSPIQVTKDCERRFSSGACGKCLAAN